MIGRIKSTGLSLAVMLDKRILKAISKFSKTDIKHDESNLGVNSYYRDYSITNLRQVYLAGALKMAS